MSYDLMFQKAIELQNAGALRQAEDIYQKILQVMPENSDVWNLLGLIAQSKGELLRATDCFLAAIKYAPTSFYAHFFNLGLCYKSLNKPKEAIDALQRCIDLKKDFKEGWNLLGILFAENNDLTEAAKCFCKALDIDAQYETARANLCYYTKDLDTLIQLAENQPDDFEVQLKAALLSEDPEIKEKFGVRAVSLEPDRLEGLLFLANLYKNSERFSEALKLYYKVLNLDENNLEAILSVADIQLALKDEATAEAYYLKSFNISRNVAGAHINYGTLLYQQKRFAEALEEYRSAVLLAPEKPEISYNLALILKESYI